MSFFKDHNKPSTENNTSDRVAMAIANRIILIQRHLAAAINRWFNRFPSRQQKWMLCFVAIAVMAGLLFSIHSSYNSFSTRSKAPYSAAHIGQASDLPKPPHGENQFQDSLTIK